MVGSGIFWETCRLRGFGLVRAPVPLWDMGDSQSSCGRRVCATKEHSLYGLSGVSPMQFRNRSRLGLGQAIAWRQLACRKVIVCQVTQYHRHGFDCFVGTRIVAPNRRDSLNKIWVGCLTSKMSETDAWRGACNSTIRDKYLASLHRVVRLRFHSFVLKMIFPPPRWLRVFLEWQTILSAYETRDTAVVSHRRSHPQYTKYRRPLPDCCA